MNRTALAIAAHPDDIELWMAGTLLLLKEAGWEIHYLNVANGCLGSMVTSAERTRRIRLREAEEAARTLGAGWHPPFCNDMEVFYGLPLLRKVGAVVREVNPSIVLTHPPVDYMEDHTETCRLAVTATFCKTFPNFVTTPRTKPGSGETALYHCMPHMLSTPLGERVHAQAFVDITSVLETKTAALACHASQKEWLDQTQGMDSYLKTMHDFAAVVGKDSKRFRFAEGWRQHAPAGFCSPGADPLAEVLGKKYLRRK